MQCCVACVPAQSHLGSLWPREVFGPRGKTTGGSSKTGCWAPRFGGKVVSNSGGRSCLSSRLGSLGNGMFGSCDELRKWSDDAFRPASAAAADRKEGARVRASVMVDPAVWIIRTAVFYVLLETGIAAPGHSRSTSDLGEKKPEDKGGPLEWIGKLFGGDPDEKKNKELTKLRSKWHASTKGILVRRYRVPSKAGGRKLLSAISSLLADDDTFRDVSTHKGCQIRRENAHAESVCCHNVRALFDELPTPHLVVEITVFPPGPITTAHYEKADKIERVLRTGASI